MTQETFIKNYIGKPCKIKGKGLFILKVNQVCYHEGQLCFIYAHKLGEGRYVDMLFTLFSEGQIQHVYSMMSTISPLSGETFYIKEVINFDQIKILEP